MIWPEMPNTERSTGGPQQTYKGRYRAGKALREVCPREKHAIWKPARDRPDAVSIVLEAERGRVAKLLPLRHGRMVRSPFTFYRGSALAMAADLASTPATGVNIQICGDAHLSNFGGYATPERRVIFSINDLDETSPGPWEWDLKRLAASFIVACRDNNLSEAVARDTVMTCVRSYRESMAEFSRMGTLELWYEALDAEVLVANIKDVNFRLRALKRLQKARAQSIAEDIFPKLVEYKRELPLIKDQIPTIFHAEGHPPGQIRQTVRAALAKYRDTLSPATQSVFDRYTLRDAAIKIVGIGSVGTHCWVLLFMAGHDDPLFLQIKEARASVLERYTATSVFRNHGQRVVHGYRLMQPASDMFLGWTRGPRSHYYVRQLRDIKINIRVETLGNSEMDLYATWCGRALALSHARSGESITLCGYMGKRDALDRAITAFSVAYADQTEKDHAAFERAVNAGSVEASMEKDR